MAKKISGSEYPLAKIFSSDFEYIIPFYQRPYAWTVDQASELFDDLYDFFRSEEEEGYFGRTVTRGLLPSKMMLPRKRRVIDELDWRDRELGRPC